MLGAGLLLWGLSRVWGLLDGSTAWALFGLWVAKDWCIYPFVRRALVGGAERVGAAALVGCEGVTEEALTPRGRVRLGGETWRAISATGAALEPGTAVRVLAVRGLELQVERWTGPAASRTDARRS